MNTRKASVLPICSDYYLSISWSNVHSEWVRDSLNRLGSSFTSTLSQLQSPVTPLCIVGSVTASLCLWTPPSFRRGGRWNWPTTTGWRSQLQTEENNDLEFPFDFHLWYTHLERLCAIEMRTKGNAVNLTSQGTPLKCVDTHFSWKNQGVSEAFSFHKWIILETLCSTYDNSFLRCTCYEDNHSININGTVFS